jgi:signal transduction histidine kinase
MKNIIESLRNLSIKHKLIALSMVTSTISVIITCAGFVVFSAIEERNDIVEEMVLVSKLLSDEISTALVYEQIETVEETLESLNARNSIVQACVFDSEGNEFAKYFRSNFFMDCSSLLPMPLDDSFEIEKYLTVKTLIKFDNEVKGYLYIIASLDQIPIKIRKFLASAVLLFIFIIAISYAITRLLQSNISKPISHLARISYLVCQGNHKVRAQYYYDDEVGELTKAFNTMLGKIQDAKETLEEKVKKRTADLEKAVHAKSEFMSNMSHEIRTPIHGITNYADFLMHDWDELSKEQKYNFIQKLYNNSTRLLSLINNLLDLSKLDANKMDFNFNDHDLPTIIESLVTESESLYINNHDLKISFESTPKDITVLCDKERIEQVVRNLLANSIKFTKSGTIKVSLIKSTIINKKGKTKPVIQFAIKDTGIGIPQNQLNYIFDKFNQSSITKTGAGGTGLGLAICKEIIKAHHGTIWAENNKDQTGCVFYFIIPYKV